MLWLGALAIGLVAGFVSGGRLDNLARLRFRWPWFVVAVLVVREATLLTPLNRVDGVQYVYLVALAALVAWTLWHVRRIAGIWLVSAGSALNLMVIAANGGRMPVAPDLAGSLAQRGHSGQYTLMTSYTHLNWLADWIALPGPMGRVLPEAYSAGDVIVAVGIGAVVALAMRSQAGSKETQARIVRDPP
ncbi:MAG: DUF5317 domain-containing protein [Candidatus Dormibacteraceae bacterium]